MDPREALNKAAIQSGTTWSPLAPAAPATAYRSRYDAEFGGGASETTLTDVERTFLMDTIIDESSMLKEVKRVNMTRSRWEQQRLTLGNRIMQSLNPGGHPESTPGVDVAPDYGRVVMESSTLTLPWTITNEMLQDNSEGAAFEQRVVTAMSTVVANDIEDLSINGDEASGDPFLHANDGYIKLALAGGAQVVDQNGATFDHDVFGTMLRALPTKYRSDIRKLRFFVGPNIWLDYVNSVAARQGNMADQYLSGLVGDPTYGGIPLRQTPFMPENGGGGTNEVQTVSLGGATGGTFTLTYNGQTTAAIAYNATTGAVQTALEALSNIAPGDVTVGGSAGAYTLTFGGNLAYQNITTLAGSGASLTGGTGLAINTTTTGAPGGTQSTILLTNPENLLFGVQQDIDLKKTTEGRQAITRNERYYALHMRVDFQIQNPEAVVIAREVAPRSL